METVTYIVCAVEADQIEPMKRLRFGQVIEIVHNRIYVKLRHDHYISLFDSTRVQCLPNSQVDAAKRAIGLPLGGEEVVVGIVGVIAEDVSGIILGYPTGRSGAVGGIPELSRSPACLRATVSENVCAGVENDHLMKQVVKAAATVDVGTGTSLAVTTVSEAGKVIGPSAPGIAPELEETGGSMGGGILTCATIATVLEIAVTLSAWWVTNKIKQWRLERQYQDFLQRWKGRGYTGPP